MEEDANLKGCLLCILLRYFVHIISYSISDSLCRYIDEGTAVYHIRTPVIPMSTNQITPPFRILQQKQGARMTTTAAVI